MKGKIFAMFAVFAMMLMGFAAIGNATALSAVISTHTFETDKDTYAKGETVTITYTRECEVIGTYDTPVDESVLGDGLETGVESVDERIDTSDGPYGAPAGSVCYVYRINGVNTELVAELEADGGIGTMDIPQSYFMMYWLWDQTGIDGNQVTPGNYYAKYGDWQAGFMITGMPSAATDHVPENQGTANNPNL